MSMTVAVPICTTPIGTHASFTQPCGDHYSGVVTRWNGPIVTLSAYSQWVDGAITTYHSAHPDDTVSLYVTRETVVEVKPVEAVCRRCCGTYLAYGPSDGLCCLLACSEAPRTVAA